MKKKWQVFSGCVNVYDNVSESDVNELLNYEQAKAIQFWEFFPTNADSWTNLNRLFQKRPEIGLSIKADTGGEFDFLKLTPSLKDLSIFSPDSEAAFRIPNYVDLFSINLTGKSSCDISFVQGFKNLEILTLDGPSKGLSAIAKLNKLWSLNLFSVKTKDVSFLSDLDSLRLLKIFLGGYGDLSALGDLRNLEYLGIGRLRKISNYDFLKTLNKLQFLHFVQLSHMEAVPSLEGQKNLQKIQLEYLSKLNDINQLKTLENLKELNILFPENFKAALRYSLLEQSVGIIKQLKHLEYTSLVHEDFKEEIEELERLRPKDPFNRKSKWNQDVEGGAIM